MISAKLYQRYAADPSAFRDDLHVDVDGIARRLGEVQDDWQRDDFAAIDPALLRCSGRSTDSTAKMRVYLERGRGHSKTTDLAVTCCYALAFATRPIRGYAFAADKDQAALLKDAMHTIVRLNPWLGKLLDVQKGLVLNIAKSHPGAGSRLDIFTSDVGSSYGILPDLIIADELCHWQASATSENDGALWHSIISSAAKRSNCLLCVISNAGFIDSWQWAVREAARTDDAWHFSRLDGPVASWLTPARLAEQERMLPAIAFARLWGNQWSSGGGDALLPSDIEAAFNPDLQPMTGGEPGWVFAAGVDLGLTRDGASVVVLAVTNDGRAGKIRLAHHKLWRPQRGQKINLLDVERHILDLDAKYRLEFVGFDPWQMEHLAQTLEADSGRRSRNLRRHFYLQPWCREIAPTAANLREQATLVIECFNDRRLQFFPCEPLRRDLHKLRVVEKGTSFRMESPRDADGHGDNYSAFANALVITHELAGQCRVITAPTFDGPGHESFSARMSRLWQQRVAEHQREQEYLRDEYGVGQPSTTAEDMRQAARDGTFQVITPSYPTY